MGGDVFKRAFGRRPLSPFGEFNRSTARAEDCAKELLSAFHTSECEADRKVLSIWRAVEKEPSSPLNLKQVGPHLLDEQLNSYAPLDAETKAYIIAAVVERVPFAVEYGFTMGSSARAFEFNIKLPYEVHWIVGILRSFIDQADGAVISALLSKTDGVTLALIRFFRFGRTTAFGNVVAHLLQAMLSAPRSAATVFASKSSLITLYDLLDRDIERTGSFGTQWSSLRLSLQSALGLKEEDSYHACAKQQITEYVEKVKAEISELCGADIATKIFSKGPEKTFRVGRFWYSFHEVWTECETMSEEKRGELFLGLIDFEDYLVSQKSHLLNDPLGHAKESALSSLTSLRPNSSSLRHLQRWLAASRIQFSDAGFTKLIRAIASNDGVYSKRLVNRALKACARPGFDMTFAALQDVFGPDGSLRRSHIIQHPGIEAKLQLLAERRAITEYGGRVIKARKGKPDPQRLRLLESYRFPDESPIHGLILAEIGLLADLVVLGSELIGKSKPSAKWLAKARKEVEESPHYRSVFSKLIGGEFDDVPNSPDFEAAMQGLIYLSADLPANEACASLAQYARNICFRTVEGVGINREKLGNACLWALINRADGGGVAHLARLLVRIKYPKVKKKIGAALDEAARLSGVSRGELEEMALATHGLDSDGVCEHPIGTGHARIAITGPTELDITWRRDGGIWTPNVPSALAAEKAAISEVRKLAKDIQMDQAVLVHRIQRVWLENRDWTVDAWKHVYAEHPLRMKFAGSLIWSLDHGGDRSSALWRDGRFEDSSGQAIEVPASKVTLWHPIGCPVAETLAWRRRLRELAIKQPFKQAHREVYLITPAELATGVYSNRFAGHVLKQHQMMTLARLNGWNVTHKIWADTPNNQPTHLVLSAFGLVAEYWTEGAGGDDPETTDSQAYLYLTTDQVRFYKIADPSAPVKSTAFGPERGEIVPLSDVPPLVFSEVMRHCDLFVGVASVANDPQWHDGGQDAQRPNQWRRTAGRDYWEGQAFGDLTQSAETRKEILSELLPNMAIGKAARIDGKFLHVAGKRRTYKIHLGSGNILMEPNDAYLCIVKSPRAATPDMRVALPFEGDTMLSLILSKALLLAADDKIEDPSILRQIGSYGS